MKQIFLTIALLFTIAVSNAQFTSARLTAAGLTCAICTKAIYNSLGKIPSVSKVDTDIKNSTFLITFKKGSSVDPHALNAAVEEAGFSVSKLSLTGQFDNVKVNDNSQVMIDGKTYVIASAGDKKLNGERTLHFTDKKLTGKSGLYHVTL